jgi:hypothetical protein
MLQVLANGRVQITGICSSHITWTQRGIVHGELVRHDVPDIGLWLVTDVSLLPQQ